MLLDFHTYDEPVKNALPENSFDEEVIAFIKKWRIKNQFSLTTSGSTGTPKKIILDKSAMINSAKMTGNYFDFKPNQSALLCLPIDKISGMMMLVRAIFWKLRLYTLPPKLHLPLDTLPAVDFAPLLPLQAITNFENLSKINTILLGGTALPYDLQKKVQKISSNVFLSYGMTETLSHIAIRRVNGKNPTTFYEVLNGITISTNTSDSLQISAPHLNIDTLQTNDIVEIISPQRFLFLGRKDNIINSGGLKIITEQVEKQIQKILETPHYIVGTPHPTLGEQVTLCIEGEKWEKERLYKLEENLKNIQPKQAIPKSIIFIPKFQYTSTGKVMRICKID